VQLLSEQVPMAVEMHATVKVLLDYINGNSVFCVVRAKML
jgi:hypothetical protein